MCVEIRTSHHCLCRSCIHELLGQVVRQWCTLVILEAVVTQPLQAFGTEFVINGRDVQPGLVHAGNDALFTDPGRHHGTCRFHISFNEDAIAFGQLFRSRLSSHIALTVFEDHCGMEHECWPFNTSAFHVKILKHLNPCRSGDILRPSYLPHPDR